ncbi:MAG: 6-carboxytetrahydropterin synthase [Bacteroidia bacterium]|nr:6-carboxytetrahydropterin synthase [Bacteroidia bacterium]
MFSVKIRDHIMIAHSLPDPAFGPAQQMHGATYVVDAEFFSKTLNRVSIVIDMGLAHEVLKKALASLAYQNLDAMPAFEGKLTTTEFLAHHIHGEVAALVKDEFSGTLRITLGESHVAWASFEGEV